MKHSNKEDTRPSLQFYPKDWMTDDGLRVCSLAAKGLWIEILFQMFFSPIRGALLHANGIQKSPEDIAGLLYKVNTKTIQSLIKELEDNRVFDRLENGTIINRKMYREYQLSKTRQDAVNTRWHTKVPDVVDTKPIQMGEEAKEIAVESLGKNKYLDFVFLSSKQFEQLEDRFGKEKANEYIERLNNYLGSKGVKYKSHYHTILNWAGKDEKDKRPKNSGGLDATLRYIREEEIKEGKHE